jgi:EmrB/QacA subfamily drug resistance transporter
MNPRRTALWAFIVTALALLMVTLDNLVVTTALPVIKESLGATLEQLEWTVNAYTLTFAVLLLTGAALGDRFGRRRMFVIGVSIFTVASAAAALAPTIETLILARAAQGIGGAIVAPLTLTILSASVPADRRGVALGAWGAIGGLAVALGPLVGGAITEGLSWQWIFWVNVPIGIVLVPLAWSRLSESYGPAGRLDLPGLGLASVGLLGIVWGVIHGNAEGWTSPSIVVPIVVGFGLLIAFLAWERRAPAPMVPPRFLANKPLNRANIASLMMSFGMFGAVFLLSQFLQVAQGYSPLQAGLRVLPWTLMPIFVAPIAGAMSDRVGGGLLMGVGLTLQAIGLAWLGLVITPTVDYSQLILPFVVSGVGMGLFFAPVANVVLSAVRPQEEGQASGVNNAIREMGGVFGVAVLASIFSSYGSYASPQTFVDGLVPATFVGAAVVAVGAVAAFAIPRRRTTAVTSGRTDQDVTALDSPSLGRTEPVYATTEA